MHPSVSLERVRKVYGSGLEAIHEVSFAVGQGEFVSLLGPSGCGKSTLLMMIAGLLPPTGGEIRTAEGPVTGPRRDVGVVFQTPVLLAWRSVLDNVLFPVEMLRLPRADYAGHARALLEMAKLAEFADKLPRELSGGMQQRVSICRALVHNPAILLMDEPFSALDALTRERFNVELLHLWSQTGTTILVVTHSIPEAIFLADRVVVLSPRPGRVVAEVDVPIPRPRSLDTLDEAAVSAAARRIRSHLGQGADQ
jgi:NitT/TauT family transport system ATP-binding protein